jgi:long-chain acyl-CoA synthetase
MKTQTLAQMFCNTIAAYADKNALGRKINGQYSYISYAKFGQHVAALAANLKSFGIQKGDRIALLAGNRMEWAITDFAALSVGAVLTPIYPTLPPNQIEYLLNDSEAKLIVISDAEQQQKIESVKGNLKHLQTTVRMDGKQEGTHDFWQLCEPAAAEDYLAFLENEAARITADDLATIIYTSGTTGLPKGVMLTHGNFITNIEGTLQNIALVNSDLFLSVLPLSHVFERMAGHFIPVSVGATIAYAESFETLMDNLGEASPTILICVPRFYEKVHAKVLEASDGFSPLKKKIFSWATEVGRLQARALENRTGMSFGLKLKMKLAMALVFKKFHQRMGGNLRLFVSGGAPLNKEAAQFFIGAGFNLAEGYGLTETSPVIAVNKIEHFRLGTVGFKVPNVEVKIAEDGEILVKGGQVTQGYFKNPEATAEVFTEDGWFCTGDIGILDDDGFLKITDRKKNILVTAGGKNVAPQPIESQISKSPFIAYAILIGDKRKFISALLVPDREILETTPLPWMQGKSIDEMIAAPEMVELLNTELENQTREMARFEKVKKFVVVDREVTIENGFLTPKMELKRKHILKEYADKVEEMYRE